MAVGVGVAVSVGVAVGVAVLVAVAVGVAVGVAVAVGVGVSVGVAVGVGVSGSTIDCDDSRTWNAWVTVNENPLVAKRVTDTVYVPGGQPASITPGTVI